MREILGVMKALADENRLRIVQSRKEGRWNYFRLAEEDLTPAAFVAVSLVLRSLERDGKIRADAKRLKQILRVDPEILCQKRSEGPC